jgi:SAM-dependent methyltransferase
MVQPLPLELPPLDVVQRLGDMLEPGVPRRILDSGAGSGRNGKYLTKLGHEVVALELDPAELPCDGQAGMPVIGDVQHLPFGAAFDVALQNEVGHLMPSKIQGLAALAELRRVTRQGGLNVVSGYLALAGRTNLRNSARMFHENELRDIYTAAGWGVLYYEEQELPNQYIGQGAAQREIVSSRAKLIAQRLWR